MNTTPTRYEPAKSLTRLPDVIDRLFQESFVVPTQFDRFLDGRRNCNLLETEVSFLVQLALPGVDLTSIQIQVVGQTLTVKAIRSIPAIENATYVWRGLTNDEFVEVFTLPTEVESEKAEATYENGVLFITLPKVEYAKPKVIEVHTTK